MAKIAYRKVNTLKFFGLKICSLQSDYIEHSTDSDSDDDDFYIGLKNEELTRRKND